MAAKENPFLQIPLIGEWLGHLGGMGHSRQSLQELIDCPDNAALPRAQKAGATEGSKWISHNGLKLCPTSGWGSPQLLKANRGVAEPQHEKAFAELLQSLGPSPLIFDLGAREGYYALWMKKARPGSRCVVVNSDAKALKRAQENFSANLAQGQFLRAHVGESIGKMDTLELLTLDEIARRLRADYITLLVADAEGYEAEILRGAKGLLKDRMIDHLMISTHEEALHLECKEVLSKANYLLLADLPPVNSFSNDGLIVARRKEKKGLDSIVLSKKEKK